MEKCHICGKTQFRTKFIVNSYPILSCLFCGFSKTDDRDIPRIKVNKELYSSNQYKEFYLGEQTRKLLKARALKRLNEIEVIKPMMGELLDVGASYGIFLEEAKKQGWDVFANEFNKTSASYLKKKGFKVFEGDYLKLKEKDSYFDVVCMWDVLEHLKDPQLALQKTRKILKKGGLLTLSMPNIESISAIIAGRKWGWLSPPDHLYHFSPRTLKLFLKKNGFKVIQIYTFNDEEEIISGLAQKISPWLKPLSIFSKPLILLESKLLLSGLIVAYAKKV